MKDLVRRVVALGLCGTMMSFSGPLSGSQSPTAAKQSQSDLRGYLQKSYLELFEAASTLNFSAGEIQSQRKALEKGKIPASAALRITANDMRNSLRRLARISKERQPGSAKTNASKRTAVSKTSIYSTVKPRFWRRRLFRPLTTI